MQKLSKYSNAALQHIRLDFISTRLYTRTIDLIGEYGLQIKAMAREMDTICANCEASITQAYHLRQHSLDILSIPFFAAGRLDQKQFSAALAMVLQRHPVLWTRFKLENNQVHCEVIARAELPVQFLALADQSDASNAWQAHAEMIATDCNNPDSPDAPDAPFVNAALAQTVLDLAKARRQQLPDRLTGPLFDCLVITCNPDWHVVLLTIDHLICDLWSIGIFFQTLFESYEQLQTQNNNKNNQTLSKNPVSLLESDSPLQPNNAFADFVTWQHKKIAALNSQRLQQWLAPFASIKCRMPMDPLPAIAPKNLQKQHQSFSAALTEAALRRAQQLQTTPMVLLLAVFKRCLVQLLPSAQMSPIRVVHNGRHNHHAKTAMGFFASSLPVIVPPGDCAQGIGNYVIQVRQALRQALRWSFVPMEYLQDYIDPQLLQIEINYIPFGGSLCGNTLELRPASDWMFEGIQPDMDIQLLVFMENQRLCCKLVHKAHLQWRIQSDKILAYFETMLHSLLEENMEIFFAEQPDLCTRAQPTA